MDKRLPFTGKRLHWAWAVLLIASVLPILILGAYCRASLDDYSYGLLTYQALTRGSGFWAAVWRTVYGYYMHWQGSFSGMALMTLTPNIFGERAYWATPMVMLFSLSLGTIRLTDTVVRMHLGGSRREAATISLAILFLSVHCVPSPRSAFFWWNGGVYYTFFYGMMLLLIERYAALAAEESPSGRLGAFLTALPLAVLAGGSNYASALLSLVFAACFLLRFLRRRRKGMPYALGITAVLAASFLISVLAPGNAVRQAATVRLSPVLAAAASVKQAFADLSGFYHPLAGLVFLLLAPPIWRLTKNISFRYPMPAFFSVFSFLLFATQNAPAFYALSDPGPDRLRNIVFYSYLLLILANEWYWLGWLNRFLHGRRPGTTARWVYLSAACLLAAVFIAGSGAKSLTGVQSAAALMDGSAAAYARERDARTALLLDGDSDSVTLPPMANRPSLLYIGDVTDNPEDWRNQALARYYGKRQVILAS